jgi:prepilin peptidase CpaA
MSLGALLQGACLPLLVLLLVAAAAQDLRTLQIANGYSIATIVLFAIFAVGGLASGRMDVSSIGGAAACAVLVLVGGSLIFALGALGGGDVKLLASVSLFAGPSQVIDLLVVTILSGGVLAVGILAGLPIGHAAANNGPGLRARLRGDMPYGPAIAAGGLWLALSAGLN